MTPRTGIATVAALCLALAAFGCSKSSTTAETSTETTTEAPTASADLTVEQAREAGVIARELEAAPDRAAEILAQHQTDAERFEALVVAIAADAALTAAYEAARTADGG